MSRDKGWAYLDDDGTVIYRASSLGSCIRSLTAARCGEPATPPNAGLRAAMDASTLAEDLAIQEFEKVTGGTVIWQQKKVELPIDIGQDYELKSASGTTAAVKHSHLIRGHIDGLWQREDDIIEIKSLSARNFEIYNSRGLEGLGWLGEKYKWQAAVYGFATQRLVRMVVYNKGHDPQSDEPCIIIDPAMPPDTFVTMDQIRSRILAVEQFASEDMYPDCTQKCSEYDAYSHIHLFDSPTVADDELTNLLNMHYELKMQVDDLTAQRDAIAETIKQSYSEGKYTAGPYTMSLSKVEPTKFDKAGLKKRYPELVDEYTIPGTPYVRMTVSGSPSTPTEGTE